MVTLANRAKVNTSTTGTGTISLGTVVAGYQSFSAAGVANGNVVRYVIEDGAEWEIGTGTYTSTGSTLTRTVSESSNAGAAISLTGDATVFVSLAASDIVQTSDIGVTVQAYDANIVSDGAYVHTDNNYTTAEKSKLAGVEAGATADQTAAEILTAIKTVDGAASGLDADLLDGQHGSYYYSPANAPDPVVTLAGAVTGAGTLTNLGNVTITTTATSDPRLTLTGDVTGTATFTNLGNATLTAVVADDSHNHIIANVDGLQTALDNKLDDSQKGAVNGLAELDATGRVPSAQLPSYVDDVLEYASAAGFPVTGETGKLYVALDSNDVYRWTGSAYVKVSDAVTSADQATKLATARNIALSGDVSGSANFDGSANITITATVADDSHNHIIGNVDGLQIALDGKAPTSHTHTASQITDFDTEVSNNASVVANTAKVSNVTHTGEVTGSTALTIASNVVDADNLKVTGNGTTSQYLRSDGDGSFTWATPPDTTANQTITLSGDATGSGTTSIVVTVADDSHNHIIGNVDGLQAALDGKASTSHLHTGVYEPADATILKDADIGVTVQGYSAVLAGTTASYTTAEETKLAGIETGATADQTAAEILTAIKTVDGAASGLDADLLDGLHASSFLQANQTITLSGDATGSGTTSIVVTVADDSHNHIIGNVDGLQAALDGKSATTHNHTLDSLSNTTITSNAAGEILKWSGTAWINNTLAEAGIQPAGSYAAASHTHTASQITDFDTEVSNNASVVANTAKVSNATHTGEVTGSTALTIASNVVDADNLKVTGNGTTSQYLRSDGDGSFTWATPTDTNTTYSAGTNMSLVGTVFSVDASPTFATADINGGTIDGTVIGGTTPAAITGTTLTATGAFTSLGIDDNAAATAMTIDSSGKLLVGTATSPSSSLMRSVMAGNGVYSQWTRDTTTIAGAYAGTDGNGFIIGTHTGGVGSETYAERMRIDSSGRLLVGITTPITGGYNASPLNVQSAANTAAVKCTATANAGTTLQSVRNTSGLHLVFWQNGAVVGTISTTASNTTYTTSSDYRLKENITPVQGAADIVKAMQPVTYTFKSDGSWHDGFLAHELQELHPRAVTGEKDAMRDEEYEVTPAVLDNDGNVVTEAVMGTRSVPDYQGVDYSKLTPILTAALQEALNKIDALEARLTALEAV